MNERRLTDAQISAALRAHLPTRARAGLQDGIHAAAGATPQQRPMPSFLGALSDGDPAVRQRSLLIAAAFLLALTLATVAVVGAWQLLRRDSRPPLDGAVSNGLIAVSANMMGDIFLVGADSAPRRIIGSDGDGVSQECPAFSADGTMLAYGEGRVIDPSANVRGRHGPVADRAVAAVRIDDLGDPSPAFFRATLGPGLDGIACPEWSPSGSRLAFRVGGELRIVDSESGHIIVAPVTDAPAGQAGLEWSRDGSMIAVAVPGQIRVVRLDGSPSTVIPVRGETPGSLGWAAGDQTIVYLATDGPGDSQELRAVRVDGTADVRLTRDPALPLSTFDPGLGGIATIEASVSNAVVSPDGRRIAYVSHDVMCTIDGCDNNDPEHVLTLDADGSNVLEVPIPTGFGVTGLHWSPDGADLLMSSIDGIVAVPVAPGASAVVQSPQNAAVDLEWSAKQVAWQPTQR